MSYMTRREELAWAAGLFEGEGSFTVARRVNKNGSNYLYIAAQLGMTDKDRVIEFWRIVGVGNVTSHDPNRPRNKVIHIWKTGSFEGVQSAIATLWPWLGPRRRSKAKEILRSYYDYTNVRRFTLASDDEVEAVKRLLASGMPKRKIAMAVGRSYGFVNHIKRGRTHGDRDLPGVNASV